MQQEIRRRYDPGSPASAAAASLGLPTDLAKKAGRRLGIISAAYAAFYALLYVASRLLEDRPPG